MYPSFFHTTPWRRGAALVAAALISSACIFDHDRGEGDEQLGGVLRAAAELAGGGPDGAPEGDEVAEAELEAEPEVAEIGAQLGEFRITFYWMAMERQDDDAQAREVVLLDRACEPLAEVTRDFAARLALEGTGRLSDGRIINVAGACDCESACYYLPRPHKRWGVGVARRPLAPFRSVAVDPRHVAIGQLLYVPELDGLTMPGRRPYGGFVHDGCVIADDRGGNIVGQQLDFFTGRRAYYNALYRRHRLSTVNVHDGSGLCARERGRVVAKNRTSI
jgi:3D (Asp-Asp-Asp) domain-containing protein